MSAVSSSSRSADSPRFAVVLSGCGVFDGAEVHESVLTLLAINRAGGQYTCYAPDIDQMHVINHETGEEMDERRNVKTEAARIARGPVQDLAQFDPADADILIFPGGFGAAKNLSSFAVKGPECDVDPAVKAAVDGMHRAGKPIGALCIAPAILAKVLGSVTLTIGNDVDTAAGLTALGATHEVRGHAELTTDAANRVVTSPCYMLDASIGQIADGAQNVVDALIDMLAQNRVAAE